MAVFNTIQSLLSRFFTKKSRGRAKCRVVHLCIEELYARITPAALTWVGGAGPRWSAAANWQNAQGQAQQPVAADTLQFNTAGTGDSTADMNQIANVVITGAYNGTVSVGQGGNLLVTDTLQIDTATLQMGFGANINAIRVTMTGGRVTAAPNNFGQFAGNVLSISASQAGPGFMTMSGGSFEAQTTLFNQYTVAVTGNVTFTGSTFKNYGLVNWNAGTISVNTGTTINNYGTFQMNSDDTIADVSMGGGVGVFNNYNNLKKAQGGANASSVIAVEFHNLVTNGQSALLTVEQGRLNVTGPGQFDSGATALPGATLELGSGQWLQNLNGVTLNGNIAVTNSLGVLANSTATVNGTLTLSGGIFGGPGSLNVIGNGSSFTWTKGTIDNFQTLGIAVGVQMQIRGGGFDPVLTNSGIRNWGSITWSGADITSYSSTISNLGSFVVAADVWINLPDGKTVSTFTNLQQGVFHKTGGAAGGDAALDLAFNNAGGAFIIDPSLNINFPVEGSFQQTSALSWTILQGGTLTVANGFNASAGEVSAFGTIAGSLTVGGTLDTGSAVGFLSITGDYNQTPNGLLKIKLASVGSYDMLGVGGNAFFGFAGQVEIDLIGSYVPQRGDAFSIIFAGTFTGRIGNPAGGYTVSQTGGDVVFTKD